MNRVIRRFTSTAGEIHSLSEVNTKVRDLVFQGQYNEALQLYKHELHWSPESSTFILPSLFKSCSFHQTHQFLGLQLHSHVVKTGLFHDFAIANSVMSMYSKLSAPQCARKVFDEMSERDTISWNAIISCYSQNGLYFESLELFREMYICGFVPKPELISGVLSMCVQTDQLKLGRIIHGLIITDELIEQNSVFLSSSLIDFYCKCCDPFTASQVFNRMEVKNEVSWTAMVSGFVANRDYFMAISFLRKMQVEGIKPNRVTCITILPACAEVDSIEHSKETHAFAIRHQFGSDIHFTSALIQTYSKCGNTHYAKIVFEKSKKKDIVMWTSMIGCSDSTDESIHHFNQMRKNGVSPNYITSLELVSKCTSNISAITQGIAVHNYILKAGFISQLRIGNSLINMYSKFGYLLDSCKVFQEMPRKDVVSWSSIINAWGVHGHGYDALVLFNDMLKREIEPDSITYLAVLSACNHAGLVKEGQELFKRVLSDEKVSLDIEHYACYIDLLGRAGLIEEALDTLRSMPLDPSPNILSTLASACLEAGRLEDAKKMVWNLLESEPENSSNFTLLSMIYAKSGEWFDVENVRREMKELGLRKNYGFSRI